MNLGAARRPNAQDFHAAFGLGTDDKHFATVDADGVALAAIQGLNQKLDGVVSALRMEKCGLEAAAGEAGTALESSIVVPLPVVVMSAREAIYRKV